MTLQWDRKVYIANVDAPYCDPLSSVVCWSVSRYVTLVSAAKTAKLIKMPFGLRTQVRPGNNVLDGGGHIPSWEGHFWGKMAPIAKHTDFLLWAVQKWLNRSISHLGCGIWWAKESTNSIVFARLRQCARRCSAMSCAKMAESINLSFGVDLGGQKEAQVQSHSLGGTNGASRRIQLNRPSVVAMQPYVKLLWPLVIVLLLWSKHS